MGKILGNVGISPMGMLQSPERQVMRGTVRPGSQFGGAIGKFPNMSRNIGLPTKSVSVIPKGMPKIRI